MALVALITLSMVIAFGSLAGCPGSGPDLAPEPGTPSYQEEAEAAYQSARTALDRRDYVVAIERFERVRNRYPRSSYAALAELGIADALYAQDRFLEAADAYRTFVSLRPAHPEAAYAAYREAVALMRQAPSNLWIMPPAHEKDLTQVQEVVGVLQRYLSDYPESDHAAEARELLDQALSRLARHELYVADFYRRRGQWQAVALRMETVLRSYPGLGFDTQARLGLAEAYSMLEEPRFAEAVALLDQALADPDIDAETAARARRLRETLVSAGGAPEQ